MADTEASPARTEAEDGSGASAAAGGADSGAVAAGSGAGAASDSAAGAGVGVGAGAAAEGDEAPAGSEDSYDTDSDDEDDLRSWLRSQRPAILQQFDMLCAQLKRRQIAGSSAVARLTAQFLRNVIGSCTTPTVGDMVKRVKQIGKHIIAAQRLDLVIGNMVRRVLYIIREEWSSAREKERGDVGGTRPGEKSLQTIMDKASSTDMEDEFKGLRADVIEGIEELIMEMDNLITPIAEQAPNHIHANEVILTFGTSATLIDFLKAAAKKHKHSTFEVIVAESAPTFVGHDTAAALTGTGIIVTVINDAAVFAMMARVDKVIIGCHAVMANGGIVTQAGGHGVALAAKHHKVPLVCVTGMYKLCPLYPHDQDTFNELLSPTAVLSFEEADTMGKVTVVNPQFDYLPPKLVDLFVTNLYGLQPSYVYRLLAEYYDPEDYVL